MPSVPFSANRQGMILSGDVEGDGPALLFLHGLAATAAMQRPNAPAGYRVAAFDQRGHGRATPATAPEAFVVAEFVADAIAVLDHLGWQQVVICGSSMGAAVALRLALDHPQRVSALALVAPAFGDTPNTEIERFDLMALAVESLGIAGAIPRMREGQVARGFPIEATQFLEGWRAHRPAPLVAALRTVGRWVPFPDIQRAAALDAPVVIVGWPDDPMHPIALAERLATLTRAPLARLDEVTEALAHPERVGDALRPLLDSALQEAT